LDNKQSKLKEFLNTWEIHLGTIIFILLTIFLNIQVISRYVFKNAITWTEELSTIMYVWLVYLGVAAAITERKHLKIDFVVDMVPFKIKRIMLIFSNIIFMTFCIYMIFPLMKIINNMGTSTSPMLLIPKALSYGILPISMVLSVFRLIQDTIRLTKETEDKLGTSKPILDLDAIERERDELLKMQNEGGNI